MQFADRSVHPPVVVVTKLARLPVFIKPHRYVSSKRDGRSLAEKIRVSHITSGTRHVSHFYSPTSFLPESDHNRMKGAHELSDFFSAESARSVRAKNCAVQAVPFLTG